MNVIADRLLALLLGWTKALFNGLWNLLGNRESGAMGFVQRFWLPIILILLAVGVVMDYVIWLIRWRPYFVWRTWLRNFGRSRRERVTRNYMESLDRSPLDLPVYTQEGPWQDSLADGDAPVLFDFSEPDGYPPQDGADQYAVQDNGYYDAYADAAYSANTRQDGMYQQEQAGLDTPYVPALEAGSDQAWQPQRMGPDDVWDPLTAEPSWMSLFHQAKARQEAEAAENLLPGNGWMGDIADQAQPSDTGDVPGARRRRSARAQKKTGPLRTIRDAIFSGGDEGPVDSLPPPVSQDSAFGQPYIPQNYRYSGGDAKRSD